MNWIVSCSVCNSSYVYTSGQGLPDICSSCMDKGKQEVKKFLEKEHKRKEIIAITSSRFEERKIVKTLGMVSHEHVFGMGLVQDLDLQKFNGGISLSWEEKIRTGKELALRYIKDEAIEMGGNAVVAVDIIFNVLGIHGDVVIVLVGAKGNAVVVE